VQGSVVCDYLQTVLCDVLMDAVCVHLLELDGMYGTCCSWPPSFAAAYLNSIQLYE
jgi:hypothetical protein